MMLTRSNQSVKILRNRVQVTPRFTQAEKVRPPTGTGNRLESSLEFRVEGGGSLN